MPILMTYWKSVWCSAAGQREYGYHAHTAEELAAFQRRLVTLRFRMPGPLQYGRPGYRIRHCPQAA